MRVLVHIGYPKAASAWMQQVVFPGHPDIHYLHLERARNEWIMRIAYDSDFSFDATSCRARFEEACATSPRKIACISWESLSGSVFLGGCDCARNANRIKSIFQNAQILVCIHNQLDAIESLYKQYVIEGGALNLRRLLELRRPDSLITVSQDFFRYEHMLSLYTNLFGPGRVHVVVVEELAAKPMAALERMASFLQIDPFTLDEAQVAGRANEALSRPSLGLMRWLNRFVGSRFNLLPLVPERWISAKRLRSLFRARLDRHLSRIPQSKQLLLDVELRDQLREQYAEGNRVFQERFDLPLEKYGYPL